MGKISFNAKADLFKALAHPTRLMIIGKLSQGMKCVNDIEDLLDVRQPNVSQHLAMLRRAGIVDFRKKGKKRCYFLSNRTFIMSIMKYTSVQINSTVIPAKAGIQTRSAYGCPLSRA